MQVNFISRSGLRIDIGIPMGLLILLSFISSGIQGVVIMSNKKMRQTDSMSMVMLLCFTEAAYFCNLMSSSVACSLKFPEILDTTVLYRKHGDTEAQAQLRAV